MRREQACASRRHLRPTPPCVFWPAGSRTVYTPPAVSALLPASRSRTVYTPLLRPSRASYESLDTSATSFCDNEQFEQQQAQHRQSYTPQSRHKGLSPLTSSEDHTRFTVGTRTTQGARTSLLISQQLTTHERYRQITASNSTNKPYAKLLSDRKCMTTAKPRTLRKSTAFVQSTALSLSLSLNGHPSTTTRPTDNRNTPVASSTSPLPPTRS